MPYVPPGPSSQSCLPRKAIATTVLEQTRRKAAAAGKTSRPSSSSGPKDVDHHAVQPSTSASGPGNQGEDGIDMSAATSQLANQLEAVHVDEPAIVIPKTLSSGSLAPSSGADSSSVSPTLSTSKSQLSSDSEDAVSAYKAALFTYTRDRLLEAKGTGTPGSPGKKGQSAYTQFGSKQSGMQKLAAKKLLARQLNA